MSVADELLALGTATLVDAGAYAMEARVKALKRGARVAGPAYTVMCAPGDSLALHVAMIAAPAGSVVVADVGGALDHGYWGAVLTVAGGQRDLAGVVVDGGVRDVAELVAEGFPVFCTGVALRGTTREAGGVIGGPIVTAGVSVDLGDWVVGDDDGVVVVHAGDAENVLTDGRVVAERKREIRQRLGEGATTLELLGLDPTTVSRG
jgi:4-hydroxy-4-methyl-2-oxoglutarate aldolase